MKQYERMEQIAAKYEGKANSIRLALQVLMEEETVKAGKTLGGKLKKAVEIHTNGNGANGNGHEPRIWERIRDYLADKPNGARLREIAAATGIPMKSFGSPLTEHKDLIKRIGHGVYALRGSAAPVAPKKKKFSAATRKRMALAMKARWAAAKKNGKNLNGTKAANA